LFSKTGVKLEILHFEEGEVNLLLHLVLNFYNRASREISVTLCFQKTKIIEGEPALKLTVLVCL